MMTEGIMDQEDISEEENEFQASQMDNESEISSIDSAECTCPDDGTILMDEIYSLPIDHLFTLCLTNSDFFIDIHASKKHTVLSEIPWTNKAGNKKMRVVKKKWALNQSIGPSFADVTETYTMDPLSKPGHYSIDVEVENAGVPYADSFYVSLHYCMRRLSEKSTTVKILGEIKYRKSVWGFVKGLIEKNTIEGLHDHFGYMSKVLHDMERGRRASGLNGNRRKGKRTIRTTQRVSSKRTKKPEIDFDMDMTTTIVFSVLLLLLVLNGMLYYQLRQLEAASPYTFMDMNLIVQSTSKEVRNKLLEKDAENKLEVRYWQNILNNSYQLLKQVEDNLLQLKECINSSCADKTIPVQIEIGQKN